METPPSSIEGVACTTRSTPVDQVIRVAPERCDATTTANVVAGLASYVEVLTRVPETAYARHTVLVQELVTRQRRAGVGTRLLHALVSGAPNVTTATQVALFCKRANTAALAFYARLGFEPAERLEVVVDAAGAAVHAGNELACRLALDATLGKRKRACEEACAETRVDASADGGDDAPVRRPPIVLRPAAKEVLLVHTASALLLRLESDDALRPKLAETASLEASLHRTRDALVVNEMAAYLEAIQLLRACPHGFAKTLMSDRASSVRAAYLLLKNKP